MRGFDGESILYAFGGCDRVTVVASGGTSMGEFDARCMLRRVVPTGEYSSDDEIGLGCEDADGWS